MMAGNRKGRRKSVFAAPLRLVDPQAASTLSPDQINRLSERFAGLSVDEGRALYATLSPDERAAVDARGLKRAWRSMRASESHGRREQTARAEFNATATALEGATTPDERKRIADTWRKGKEARDLRALADQVAERKPQAAQTLRDRAGQIEQDGGDG
jgi:hypothetical protein